MSNDLRTNDIKMLDLTISPDVAEYMELMEHLEREAIRLLNKSAIPKEKFCEPYRKSTHF